jgi:hypothetical protein
VLWRTGHAITLSRLGMDGVHHRVIHCVMGHDRGWIASAVVPFLLDLSRITPAHQPEPIQRLDDSAAAPCCRLQTRRKSRHLSTF